LYTRPNRNSVYTSAITPGSDNYDKIVKIIEKLNEILSMLTGKMSSYRATYSGKYNVNVILIKLVGDMLQSMLDCTQDIIVVIYRAKWLWDTYSGNIQQQLKSSRNVTLVNINDLVEE
jgi:hypothetical protein